MTCRYFLDKGGGYRLFPSPLFSFSFLFLSQHRHGGWEPLESQRWREQWRGTARVLLMKYFAQEWPGIIVAVFALVTKKMEALALVPRDGTTTEDAFTKLATNFKLSEVVKDALIRSKLENLEEFRFLFDEESKVEPWVVKLKLGDDHTVQAARLRRAWSAVRLYFQQSEQDRSKVTASDLDSMLGDTELRDTKLQFWRRYRQRYPAEVHPSDATLSRVTREMSKRMLCVFHIWKARSLQFQLHTSTKKRKVGENLFTEDKEDEEQCDQDWETYLNKLHTLLLAYAMAGSSSLAPPAGDVIGFDSLGADATKYLEVPLDVAMAYFWRAKRTTCVLPMSKRLQWLKARDTEERSEWVSRFRESTDTLGVIFIKRSWWPAMPIGFLQSPNRGVTPCWQGEEMPSTRNHRTQSRLVISNWESQSMGSRWPVPCVMAPSYAKPFSMGNARIRHPARAASTGVLRLPRRNGFAAPRGTGRQHAVITKRPEAAQGRWRWPP